jgi:hypothetical protein
LGYFTTEVPQSLIIGRSILVGAVQYSLDPADRRHHFLTGGNNVGRRFQIVCLPGPDIRFSIAALLPELIPCPYSSFRPTPHLAIGLQTNCYRNTKIFLILA